MISLNIEASISSTNHLAHFPLKVTAQIKNARELEKSNGLLYQAFLEGNIGAGVQAASNLF